MKYLFVLVLVFIISFLFGQSSSKQKAQNIIDMAIEKHGGQKYNNSHYEYDFRKYHYTFHYNNGQYQYERYDKSLGIKDILTNEGFSRYQNDRPVTLSAKQSKAYTGSVNSVHYFAFLPFFLNDPAVHKDLIGEVSIKGKTYYKIRVTFNEEGGGVDHDDIYIYWFGKEDYMLDYLAYSFHVNGGGVRFRSAYNRRSVDGITFQDYVNYKHDKLTPVQDLDQLYDSGLLTELSRIELKNISASPK